VLKISLTRELHFTGKTVRIERLEAVNYAKRFASPSATPIGARVTEYAWCLRLMTTVAL